MDRLEFENFEVNASGQPSGDQRQNDVRPSEDQAVQFSSKVMAALEQKTKEHNSNYSKVTAEQLKKVYRHGADSLCEDQPKGLCAMARVNMFLRMKQRGKITYQESTKKELTELKELVFESKSTIKVNTFVDITESWLPIESDFIKAAEDVKKYELNYDFKSVDELYLDEYKSLDIIWG